ncbi:hypothetical protein LHK94_11665 [Dickeya zeae]|nr:hypothetical protein LHK94_11665 [Dickeya zeae]
MATAAPAHWCATITDMRAMGFDVSKKFTRWLDKFVKDGQIALDGENIVPLSKRGNVGE